VCVRTCVQGLTKYEWLILMHHYLKLCAKRKTSHTCKYKCLTCIYDHQLCWESCPPEAISLLPLAFALALHPHLKHQSPMPAAGSLHPPQQERQGGSRLPWHAGVWWLLGCLSWWQRCWLAQKQKRQQQQQQQLKGELLTEAETQDAGCLHSHRPP